MKQYIFENYYARNTPTQGKTRDEIHRHAFILQTFPKQC